MSIDPELLDNEQRAMQAAVRDHGGLDEFLTDLAGHLEGSPHDLHEVESDSKWEDRPGYL